MRHLRDKRWLGTEGSSAVDKRGNRGIETVNAGVACRGLGADPGRGIAGKAVQLGAKTQGYSR